MGKLSEIQLIKQVGAQSEFEYLVYCNFTLPSVGNDPPHLH